MEFLNFELRAWQFKPGNLQVLVHSSPVGSMRTPVSVVFNPDQLNHIQCTIHQVVSEKEPQILKKVIKTGKELSRLLLPSPVINLLKSSLTLLEPEQGLRIRLCLDEFLIDLPWEYLWDATINGVEPLGGFLILNPRISLVREAPTVIPRNKPSINKQRMLFVGTLWEGDIDPWYVKQEYDKISQALTPIDDFLETEFITASSRGFEVAFSQPVSIFHYSGHTDVLNECGYLLKEVHPLGNDSATMRNDILSIFLQKAKTQLAMFSACNSGRWKFVKPFLNAGLPALIGAQGIVSTAAAVAFCEKLYNCVAIGLSLDEAVSWARLHLLETQNSTNIENYEWGTFMVYMPAVDSVLFPKLESTDIREHQQTAIRGRDQTIINVNQYIGYMESGSTVTGASIGQITNSSYAPD